MKSSALLSLLISITFSCTHAQDYGQLRAKVDSVRVGYKRQYTSAKNKDSILVLAGHYVEKTIATTFFEQWKETPWDFNGYTAIPKQGNIACGYYVSTNLKHIGINIDRYKMAQQSSKNEVLSLDPNPITYNGNTQGFIQFAHSNLSDGLYIMGMSTHVGMVQKKGSDIYLLHSSPFGRLGVTKEKIESCLVLDYSSIFIIGKISGNKELMKKWLNGTLVNIILD